MKKSDEVVSDVLGTLRLPTSPDAAIRIVQSCENSTEGALLEAVASDPVLTARLVAHAECMLAALKEPVLSVERAAELLGERGLRLLALSFSLEPAPEARPDLVRSWTLARVRARAARALALDRDPRLAPTAALAALLMDLDALDSSETEEGPRPGACADETAHPEAGGARRLDAWGFHGKLLRLLEPERVSSPDTNTRELQRLLQAADGLAKMALGEVADGTPVEQRLEELGVPLSRGTRLLEELESRALEEERRIRTASATTNQEAFRNEARRMFLFWSLRTVEDEDELFVSDPAHHVRVSEHPALHEASTGLANLRAMRRFLRGELGLRSSRRVASPLGLLMIQLEGNELLETGVAEELHKLAAFVLLQGMRSQDVVGHLSQDRFAILVAGGDKETLVELARRIRRDLTANGGVLGDAPRAGVSLGGVFISGSATSVSVQALLFAAENALAEAQRMPEALFVSDLRTPGDAAFRRVSA